MCVEIEAIEVYLPRPPVVEYVDFDEFLRLQSEVRIKYAELIDQSVHRQMIERRGKQHWTEYDLILLGVGTFPELARDGLNVIMKMTKGVGVLWCAGLNRDIVGAVTTASRTYINTIMSFGVMPPYVQINPHIPTMIDMMKSSLYEYFSLTETSQYPYCWVSSLVEAHFEFAFYNSGVPRLIVTKEEWLEYLVALLMVCEKYKIPSDLSVNLKNLLKEV